MTDAHLQKVTRSYAIRYPAHPARTDDPHYADFNHYHKRTRGTARCAMGLWYGDFSECRDVRGEPVSIDDAGAQSDLELHHKDLEFALANEVDLALLEKKYPGVSNPDAVGAWVESAENLEWLCVWHHRSHGGKHVASFSDFTAEEFVRGLIA